jgi:glycosyl transferase family 25
LFDLAGFGFPAFYYFKTQIGDNKMAGGVSYVCISLTRAHERRAAMERQFEQQRIDVRFFDAIEPAGPLEEIENYDMARRCQTYGVPLTRGEVGCFLSHRQVWRELVESGDEACCIMEDDIVLRDGIGAAVNELFATRSLWDMVRLMGLVRSRPKIPTAVLASGLKLMWMKRHPDGTQCYLITRQAAARMLEYTDRFFNAVDNAIDRHWDHQLRLYITSPEFVELADTESMIGDRPSPPNVIVRLRVKFHRRIDKLRMVVYHMRNRPRQAEVQRSPLKPSGDGLGLTN